jgi:hypothetical protein
VLGRVAGALLALADEVIVEVRGALAEPRVPTPRQHRVLGHILGSLIADW